ncbi:hypothetical protein ACJMK2_003915 [Sinanodonta woodiana]|uniref:EF-hand domain-containing protein n=1 Tax=Sinanodonta woodiana TaxID=1069815 RepID=A0ABD3Y1W9_SINWO
MASPYQGYGQTPSHAQAGQIPPGSYGQSAYGGVPGQNPYGAQPGGQYGAAYGGAMPGYVAPAGGYGAPGGVPQSLGGYGGAPPGIDPQVYQWFMSVDRDRSGRITAHELQEALVNSNWSHFNPETCRLMIGMFDRDQTGTIELHEFQALWNYILQWKGVFESVDINRSGSIEAQELQTALQSMGYNLSYNFVQMVVIKFDIQSKRCLTLDNFIQACVMLKSLTDMFRQRDTSMQGQIRINYEDFMTMAVSNKP